MPNIAARAPSAYLVALLLTALLLIAPAAERPAIAQSAGTPPLGEGEGSTNVRTCLPHEGVDAKLRHEFGEKKLGHGISADGTLLEVFMAPAGTFTVVKTVPDGTSCVVDFGEGWQTLNQLEVTGLTKQDLEIEPRPF